MMKPTLFALTFIAAAIAQPPGAGGPAFDDIKTYMNLSDTQLNSIRQAGQQAMQANQTLRQQMATKQTALNTAIANGSADAAAIGRAMLEIAALRKQADANTAKAREQAVSFLSADQKTKLKALDDAEKLREEIGQAHALQLLAPPAGGPGGFFRRSGENFPGGPPLTR